jgi:hypothetical protein
MNDVDRIEEDVEDHTGDRVRESVQHALRLVGPAEGGAERYWPEDANVTGPAARAMIPTRL